MFTNKNSPFFPVLNEIDKGLKGITLKNKRWLNKFLKQMIRVNGQG